MKLNAIVAALLLMVGTAWADPINYIFDALDSNRGDGQIGGWITVPMSAVGTITFDIVDAEFSILYSSPTLGDHAWTHDDTITSLAPFAFDGIFGTDPILTPTGPFGLGGMGWVIVNAPGDTLVLDPIANFGSFWSIETAAGDTDAHIVQGGNAWRLVVVPEPATFFLIVTGVAIVARRKRRRCA